MSSALLILRFLRIFRAAREVGVEFEFCVVGCLVFWWCGRALRLGDRKLPWVRRLSNKDGFMINPIPILTAWRNSGSTRRVR